MSAIAVFAPAKINLFLAITGRRPDGFHNLVSVVAPLEFGDRLWFEPAEEGEGFSLSCAEAEVPLGEDNLILRAARLHAEAGGGVRGGRFVLKKSIPMGAGLGGGSSDASAALRALELAGGGRLGDEMLASLAARIGSDCPLFLAGRSCVMRGRGELLSPLHEAASRRLAGRRILLFKPGFGISTPWAYKRMVEAAPRLYLEERLAEQRLATWLAEAGGEAESLLYNNMEAAAFDKHRALPVLLERLREEFGLQPRMSGSGSCCFTLVPEGFDLKPVVGCVKACWGADCFVVETRLAV